MSRADTPEILIPAIATNAQYVANLDKAAKKKPLTKAQEKSRASALAKLNDYVRRYTALTPAAQPTAEPPVIPGDAIALSKAWNRIEAADNINAVYERAGIGDTATPEQRIAALGDGLAAQAIALSQFGFPYWGPGQAMTQLTPEQFAIADRAGGLWGRADHLERPGEFHQRIFNASKLVADVQTPSHMADEEIKKLAKANGLDDAQTGPA